MTFFLGSFYTHLMEGIGGIRESNLPGYISESHLKNSKSGSQRYPGVSIETWSRTCSKSATAYASTKAVTGKLIDQAILYIQNHYMSSSFFH